MKKLVMMFLSVVFFGGISFATVFSDALAAAVATGNEANVMALLGTEGCKTNEVYRFACMQVPKESRISYAEALPDHPSKALVLLGVKGTVLGRGAAFNAILEAHYATTQHSLNWADQYSPGDATLEQCIAYYESVIKNVPLNEKTLAGLSKIKGELLKLKGL